MSAVRIKAEVGDWLAECALRPVNGYERFLSQYVRQTALYLGEAGREVDRDSAAWLYKGK